MVAKASQDAPGHRIELWNRLHSWLLLAYAASLPLSMTASWVLLTIGLVLWSMGCLYGSASGGETRIKVPPLALPLAVLAAAIALSGAAAGGLSDALSSVWSLKGILVYFWAYQFLSVDRQLLNRCFSVLLLVGSAAGIWGAIQQVFNFHPFGYPYLQGTGFLGGPMPYAGQMQLLSLLGLGILFLRGNSEMKFGLQLPILFYSVVACNCLGVLFAAERGAWFGFVVALSTMTAALSFKILLAYLGTAAALGTGVWLLVPVVRIRLEPLLHWQQDISVRVRLFLWQQAIERWKESPWVGLGFRHFPRYNIPEAIVPGRSVDINHAHSNYLQILATTGIVGLATYVFLWASALAVSWKAFLNQRGNFERGLSLGIFAGTVSLLSAGVFEYNFGTAQVRLMQWFLLAALPAAVTAVHSPANQAEGSVSTQSEQALQSWERCGSPLVAARQLRDKIQQWVIGRRKAS